MWKSMSSSREKINNCVIFFIQVKQLRTFKDKDWSFWSLVLLMTMVHIDKSMGLLQKEKEKPEEESPSWEGTSSRQSPMKGTLQKQKTYSCHRSRRKRTAGCCVHADGWPSLSVQLVEHDSIFVTAFVGKWVEEGMSPFLPCCSKLRRV